MYVTCRISILLTNNSLFQVWRRRKISNKINNTKESIEMMNLAFFICFYDVVVAVIVVVVAVVVVVDDGVVIYEEDEFHM